MFNKVVSPCQISLSEVMKSLPYEGDLEKTSDNSKSRETTLPETGGVNPVTSVRVKMGKIGNIGGLNLALFARHISDTGKETKYTGKVSAVLNLRQQRQRPYGSVTLGDTNRTTLSNLAKPFAGLS